MTIKLSWNVRLQLNVYSYSQLQETKVSIIFGRPVQQEEIAGWRIALESIALVVNHGAICGNRINPAQSTFTPVKVEQIGSDGVYLEFKIAGVDPGGWRVIAGLLVMSTYGANNPIVKITSTRATGIPDIVNEQVWSLAYPAIPDKLPFALHHEEPNPSSYDVLLQIRFYKDLNETQAEEVVSVLSAWSSMLFGGYAEDGADLLDCSTDSQEVYLVDPRTVEYAAAYTGAEAGLDAAVLMAFWFHENLLPVESVLLE